MTPTAALADTLTERPPLFTTVGAAAGAETPAAPATHLSTAFAAPRTDTTARLNGYLNPEGSAATYRFEYSDDGLSWIRLPDEQTPEARGQILISEKASALPPNTTFRYRFSVENDAGYTSSAESTFTTRSSTETQLPKRGIELVNQPDKGNQNVSSLPLRRSTIASEEGNRVLWSVTGGAPGANTGAFATFLARRTPEGWQSRSLIPPPEAQLGGGSLAYRLNEANASLTRFLFRVAMSGSAYERTAPALVRIDDLGHQEVLRTLPPSSAIDGGAYAQTEMTEDLSDVLLVDPASGQLEDAGSSPPEVISLMPDGMPDQCGLALWGQSFTGNEQWRPGYRLMAGADARRAYFQAVPNGTPCNAKRAIFYRDRNAGQTTEVDAGGAATQSLLIRATPDGRSVYFVSDASHSPSDANASSDIYRWDSETGTYSCLTCVVSEAAPLGRVLVSDDFSHIYFTSRNQLLADRGRAGDLNLYVLRDGEMGFVTDLGPENVLGPQESEVSEDGNVLVFEYSNAQSSKYPPLTSDRLAESCRSGEFDGNCSELYRYEDAAESLECISCRLGAVTQDAFTVPYSFKTFGISADGSTIALLTRERLLSEDVNDWYDIYEWRGGALGLISDGKTHYPLGLGGASPMIRGLDRSGDNIFFSLVDPGLTGYEQDELANLYDARLGGGFPPPQRPAPCSEESCQGPIEPAPSRPSARSHALGAAGNVRPQRRRRCRGQRAKARRHCLYRHRKYHIRDQRARKQSAGGSW